MQCSKIPYFIFKQNLSTKKQPLQNSNLHLKKNKKIEFRKILKNRALELSCAKLKSNALKSLKNILRKFREVGLVTCKEPKYISKILEN